MNKNPINWLALACVVFHLTTAAVVPLNGIASEGDKIFNKQDLEPELSVCDGDTFLSGSKPFLESKIKASELSQKAEDYSSKALPNRYLNVAVVVEYPIFDRHFSRNLQNTLRNVQDYYFGTTLDYNELNVHVSLVGVIIWTQNNLFGLDLVDLTNYSKKYKSTFNHDHMVLLRSGSYETETTNGVVGVAFADAMCNDNSVSWATAWSPATQQPHQQNQTMAIISHEMGHSVGFPHQGNECLCSAVKLRGEYCRMGGSTVVGGPFVWDSCSRSKFDSTSSKYTCLNKTPKIYRIRSDYGNKRRLDVYLGNTSPGSRVVMWDGNSGDTQQWYVGGDMTIRWIKNDYCLTSNGLYPAYVTMESCDDDRRNNKFIYNYWTKRIEIATDPTRCLNIPNNDNGMGARVTESVCSTSSSMKWYLVTDQNVEMPSNIWYGGDILTQVPN